MGDRRLIVTEPARTRVLALTLIVFALLGLAGHWQELPAWLLLAGLGWLPGFVALAPCRTACLREGNECPMVGPGAFALAGSFSLLLLVPTVLPTFVRGVALADCRMPLATALLLIGAAGLARPVRILPRSLPAHGLVWVAFLGAVAALLPAVLRYAGGTVDDWWDLAFVRAYTDRGAASFAEPILGTGRVHPRFAWNGWLVLQALVVAFSGADPSSLQSGALAGFVCLSSVSGAALGASAIFTTQRRIAVAASIAFFPAYIWGTEAFPYFMRLYQDKFTVVLVMAPAMLACGIHYLETRSVRFLVLLAVASAAAASVHGVAFAVGALGVCVCAVVTILRTRASRRPNTQIAAPTLVSSSAAIVFVLGIAAIYPLWQAWSLRSWFATQGISLAAPDNPVVRAHLALGRLLWSHSPAYVVHPGAVFGPIALLAVVGLVAAWTLRRDRAASYLLGLSIVPCCTIFIPFIAAAAGEVVVPWMLYRIGWLVPVAPLLGLLVERASRYGGARSAAALFGIAIACSLLVVPTARDRVRRDMLEHPAERERAPSGTQREVYGFLRRWPEAGAVIAPAGFAELTAAMTGRPTVATSERGTLVFSGDEIQAYQRLRDRAAFFAVDVPPSERERIARRWGVRLAVFRRRRIAAGSERRWLNRGTAEGFLLTHDRQGRRSSGRLQVARTLPTGWRVVFWAEDFYVVRTPYDAPLRQERPRFPRGRPLWLSVFEPQQPDARGRAEVLASIVGWPGARVGFEPPPIALGATDRPVWIDGGSLWDDGPETVDISIDLGMACRVEAIEIVPFLRTERREVLEVTTLGLVRRLYAVDGRPLVVRIEPRVLREIRVRLRSMVGAPFALSDLRVLGVRESCAGGWDPPARPSVEGASAPIGDLIDLARRYPNDAIASLGLVRRLVADGRPADAEAVARDALSRDPRATVAWLELGLLVDGTGRYAEALLAYRRGLRADTNSAWARGCIAWAELRASHPLRALYQSWRAARLDGRYSDAYTIMAAAARELGLRAVARRLLNWAIYLDPRRSWPYLELARMQEHEGNPEGAVRVLSRLLELVPDEEQARSMIARLRGERAPGLAG